MKLLRQQHFSFLLLITFLSSNVFAIEQLSSSEFLENNLVVDAAVSPDGKSIATIWYVDKKNSNIVTIQDLTKPSKPIVATINERISLPKKLYWPNNERLVMVLRIPKFLNDAKAELASDPENFNIYNYVPRTVTVSVNRKGRDLVQFRTQKNGRLINTIRSFLAEDKDHILMETYVSGRKALMKVNLYTGVGERVTTGGKHTVKFLADNKGLPKYRVDYLPISKAYEIFEYVSESWINIEKVYLRSLKDELNEDFKSYDTNLININDENLVYLKANKKTGYKEIITVNAKTKKKKVLVSLKNKDIIRTISNIRTSEISGYQYLDKDIKRTVYFDVEKQKVNLKISQHFPYDGYSLVDRSDDNNLWIIESDGANEQSYYLYTVDKEALELHTHVHRYRKPENLGLPANLTYKARDGLKIRSYLLLPPTYQKGSRFPLIVLPHGGPQARDHSTFNLLAQFLSTRGYIVIQPNFRGSTGYGRKFEEMGYKQWGQLMQEDLEDAVHFLVKKGYVNKAKVCILGGSYGGYAALMGLIKTPELYQCAVSINGVSNLKEMIEHKNTTFKNRPDILSFINKSYGNLEKDESYLDRNSPIEHVNKITKPILILAGERDRTVLVEQSLDFVQELKIADKSVEAYYAKWGGHNLFHYSNCRKEGYKKIEEFLSKNLGVPLITIPGDEKQIKKTSFWLDNDKSCLQDKVSF